MERNIPDVRDIFGPKSKQQQELRTYDYSPRSRRRHEAMDGYDQRLPPDHGRTVTKERKTTTRPHRNDDPPEVYNSNKKGKDYNRTLTERDIRHLERHLSMKKTIRKQISRNLAQAFVDEPGPTVVPTKPDKAFTLTRAKVSKSEQNVLDQLKDNEPDSGHCSGTDNRSDDEENVRKEKPLQKAEVGYKEDGKFSFWKMFSVKSRGKR